MIVNHPYFYSRKTCMNSAAKRVIAALSLTALVASCGSNPASYTQFAGTVSRTTATDATDFNCPAASEEMGGAYPRRTRMAVGMPAPARMPTPPPMMMAPPPPTPPPPPPKAPVLAGVSAQSYAAQSKVADASRQSVIVTGTQTSPAPQIQSTEKYPLAAINSVKQTAENPISTFAMEVDTASYANARRFVRDGSLPPADVVRVEEFLNYFDYGYAKSKDRILPFSTTVAVAPSPWAGEKQIVHVGLSGYDIPRSERPPLNLTMLMDVSGSMTADDRLPLAKRALALLAPNLNGRDRISIVVYAGAAGVVLKPTAGNQTRDIVCALEILQAGGSTAGGEGIRLAYETAAKNYNKDGVNRVILMTDGDFNVGISDPRALQSYVTDQRKKGIYLSVFGFGRGNYNDTMMQSLAQNGNGVATYIDTIQEARKVFDTQISGTLFPIADDVKAQVEFNPARVKEWRLIGYETRALNREDFNNDAVDAGEIGAGHQVTALYEITPVGAQGSVDPLRYGAARHTPATGKAKELGLLRLRYKVPGEATSRLIERPITDADRSASFDRAPESTRFAVAVAGYAQLLRQDPWVGKGFGYADVARIAKAAKGEDRFGFRDEFIDFVSRAEGLERLPNQSEE
jgi:Ca-activated chloride channel family protein